MEADKLPGLPKKIPKGVVQVRKTFSRAHNFLSQHKNIIKMSRMVARNLQKKISSSFFHGMLNQPLN
jgi:hypothetical protein